MELLEHWPPQCQASWPRPDALSSPHNKLLVPRLELWNQLLVVHVQLPGNLVNVVARRDFNPGFHSNVVGLGMNCMWPSCLRMVCEVFGHIVLVPDLVDKACGDTEMAGNVLDSATSMDVCNNFFAESLHDDSVLLTCNVVRFKRSEKEALFSRNYFHLIQECAFPKFMVHL